MATTTRRMRWAILLALLAGAGWLAVFGDKTPAGAARVASTPAVLPPVRGTPPAKTATAPPLEALLPRTALAPTRKPMADLFAVAAWRVTAPPPPPPAAPARITETPAAPAPNYKVLGKKREGNTWEVFLGREELSFIVRTGDTLEAAWRVDRIEPPAMTLTHLPSGQSRTLPIGDDQ